MELNVCPYCGANGLVLSVRAKPGGMEVHGRCVTCGYVCDSDYASTEQADDDLRCEFSTSEDESLVFD